MFDVREAASGALVVALAAAIFFYWTGRRERRMLAKIPGPSGFPVVGLLFEAMCPLEEMVPKAFAWAREYGPILKLEALGVQRVLLSGPDEIEVVLSSRENITKDSTLTFLHPWLGTGLLTSTGTKWRARRKMLTPAFHYKNLEDFVHVFNANSAILVAKLGEHMADEYIEIDDYVSLCTLDILCESTLGTSVHAQVGGEEQYVTAVKQIFDIFQQRVRKPWLHIDFIYRLSSLWKKQQQVISVLHGFSEKVINERRARHETMKSRREEYSGGDDHPTRLNFLDMLIGMSELEGVMTDEDIREEVDTIMVTGHDSTATTISWALFLLGSHTDVQDKVVAELSAIFGSDRRQPTMADLQNMTYLDMVIKEVSRLYPSSANISRKLEADLKIGNYSVPAGTNVVISIGIVHRNPDIYPEPDKFDPERFSPEQTSGRHPYAYIPFSAGPRNCIGQKFARLVLKSVLSAILRSLRVESRDQLYDVTLMPGVVLKPKERLRMRISLRDSTHRCSLY